MSFLKVCAEQRKCYALWRAFEAARTPERWVSSRRQVQKGERLWLRRVLRWW